MNKMIPDWVLFGIVMGVAATFTMDQLGKLSRGLEMTSGIDGRWIGRWFLNMADGRFFHADIQQSPAFSREASVSRLIHYLIGIILAILYLAGTGRLGFSPENLFIALGYGIATNVFPWFLMFPAMGYGLLGLKGPPGRKLFLSSLVNHIFYGFGLWWVAMVFRWVIG